ncbi:MAG: nucleotidyltransferase [Chloroflexi bacterium]|nr:nucleotidyltransferase [Chloroflexota bacterium]
MIKIYRTDLSFILNEIADQLDLPDSLHEEAVERYQAVGKWLGEGDSPLIIYSPVIYPQGSFLLGTVTKRWGEKDEYDIDLVFEINLSKNATSQKRLKKLVGDRLKESEIYCRMLDEEGRRCWTLVYANEAKFHLDILPAIPNTDFRTVLKSQGVQSSWADTSIAITDKTHPNYDRIDPDWPRCNPKGYAAWFHSRMVNQYEALRKQMAEAMKAEIQAVPDYQIKTPLQKSVQLIKRHRDIMFETKDDKPATIVLTTLAALAYNNEFDLVQALTRIVEGMPNYITKKDGKPWVQNPVDPSENFADRWQDRAGREQDFWDWHKKIKGDLYALLECEDIDRIYELLNPMFGERVTENAMKRYKDHAQTRIKSISTVVPIRNPNQPWGF